MVFEEIKQTRIRKSSLTMTSVVITLLIVMGIYFGGYYYINDNVQNVGDTLDVKYSEALENMTASQNDLDANVQAIRDNFNNIAEADNTYLAVVNGMKGLGNTLKLPITFADTTLSTWTSIILPTDVIPGWAKNLIFIGLLTFIVFLVLKVLKGEPNL